MGNYTIIEYIDRFREYLVCCTNVCAAEVKYIVETNMTNWLALYVLPNNYPDLP